MSRNIVDKLISSHLVSGRMHPGSEVSISIDQTLTQDALGPLAYLQFETMEVERVRTRLSVSYVDHLMLQQDFENADDQRYLKTVADRYGILFSKPGNGICHQLHLERLSRPGWSLLGGDSHTPTAGAAGMLAIGAGGLDVAVAMAGGAFYFSYPKVVQVYLEGRLQPWVGAKDVILELLKIMGSRGNAGIVLEYGGPGVATLSVPERATIANMGTEIGATTSVFPSDAVTRSFFVAQAREEDYVEVAADEGAAYDKRICLDLSQVEPNIALPGSPDRVRRIAEVEGVPVDQVLIGSCTNSSFKDLMTTATLLRGRKIHPDLSLGVAAGTRQVMRMIAAHGGLTDMVEAGARILESGCGFCVGYGQAPYSGAVSLRTSNRNQSGRSGTKDAKVYLVSPESAVAAALNGSITDPRNLCIDHPVIVPPDRYHIDDTMFVQPSGTAEIFRGPNLGGAPRCTQPADRLRAGVVIKLGDGITTDDIIPAGPVSRFRSNIEKSSEFIFKHLDGTFADNCRSLQARQLAAVIVAGENYGQGASREHAAICPMHLGVRAVIAKSIERIQMTNLVNFGILPLLFADPRDYDRIGRGDELEVDDIPGPFRRGEIMITNSTRKEAFPVRHTLTSRQVDIVLHGGLIRFTAQK